MAPKERRLHIQRYIIIFTMNKIGLTVEERKELLQLRAEIKKYRELDHNNQENEDHDEDNHSAQSEESVNKYINNGNRITTKQTILTIELIKFV